MFVGSADRISDRLLMGVIAGAHGVHGEVRVKSFTAVPDDLINMGPFTDMSGSGKYLIKFTGRSRGLLLGAVNSVRDRNSAEALRGTKLYVKRDVLPPVEEDEFYYADLVGLKVFLESNKFYGEVKSVQEYGAGDVLEIIRENGQTDLLPFTLEIFPKIEIKANRLVIAPPKTIEAESSKQNNDPDLL